MINGFRTWVPWIGQWQWFVRKRFIQFLCISFRPSHRKSAPLWSDVGLNSRFDVKDTNPTSLCCIIFASTASFPSSWLPSFVSSHVFPPPTYIPSFSFLRFFLLVPVFLSPSHVHLLLSGYHLPSFSLLFNFLTFFIPSAFSFFSFHLLFVLVFILIYLPSFV